MAGKVRTWVWVVAGLVIVGILALVAAAGIGFYLFSRHFETTAASARDAAAEFDAVRARFAGQTPLLELDSGGRVVRSRTERPVQGQPSAASQVHVLAFDPSDERVVRFRVPFWMLRMGAGGATIQLDGTRVRLEDLGLTVDDLERYGPTLLVDHQTPRGERVVVWTQ